MTTKTVWEQGDAPGRQMVTLGLAVALTVVALDLLLTGRVSVLFDIAFVALSIALALRVRPRDFFTVGVLPPLVMVVVFVLLGASRPGAVAHPDDSLIQAVISGLSHHSLALVLGYGLSLTCLAIRQRVIAQHQDPVAATERPKPRTAPDRQHHVG